MGGDFRSGAIAGFFHQHDLGGGAALQRVGAHGADGGARFVAENEPGEAEVAVHLGFVRHAVRLDQTRENARLPDVGFARADRGNQRQMANVLAFGGDFRGKKRPEAHADKGDVLDARQASQLGDRAAHVLSPALKTIRIERVAG